LFDRDFFVCVQQLHFRSNKGCRFDENEAVVLKAYNVNGQQVYETELIQGSNRITFKLVKQ
jgi:hypothetical protein